MARSGKQKGKGKKPRRYSAGSIVKVVMSKDFEAGFMEEMYNVMASVNFDMDEKRTQEYIR
jgi:hypothetical protein